MSLTDPETKRKGIETAVKAGVAIVGLAIAGPFIWMALEGAIALAAFGAVALVLWGVAPAAAQFVANKRIAALVAVIEANPIETMQTVYIEKMAEFKRQEEAITEFDTQFRNVSDLVEGLKKTDPEESKSYAEMRDQMQYGLTELREEQRLSADALEEAHKAIEKMQRIWKVANAMNKALTASASAQSAVFQQMKIDVGTDAVRSNLNRAMARLNTAVERRKNGSYLPSAKPVAELPPASTVGVIDLTTKSGSRVISIKS